MEYITTKKFAEKVGRDESQVRKWCRDNRIPGAVLFGKSWAIPEDAVAPESISPWKSRKREASNENDR